MKLKNCFAYTVTANGESCTALKKNGVHEERQGLPILQTEKRGSNRKAGTGMTVDEWNKIYIAKAGTWDKDILIDKAYEIINRQKAEIERLNKELIEQKLRNNMLYEIAKEAENAALIRFANTLINNTIPIQFGGKYNYDVISKEGIERTLKEMGVRKYEDN